MNQNGQRDEGTQDELLAKLQVEFSSLDSALIASILNDTLDITLARQTLNILKGETSIADEDVSEQTSKEASASDPGWGGWMSDTDMTSFSSLRISDEDEEDDRSPPDNLKELARMFPKQSEFTLKNALNGAQGDVSKAIDVLLNRVFLEEDPEGDVLKGVDAFGVEMSGTGKKRGKRKNGTGTAGVGKDWKGSGGGMAGHSRERSLSLGSGNSSTKSRWDLMSEEIDYLSKSLNLPKTQVSSAYHSHGSALAPAIAALLDAHYDFQTDENLNYRQELRQLSLDFGNEVKQSHLSTLLLLCRENKDAVFKLAEILRKESKTPPSSIPLPKSPPQSPKYPSSSRNQSIKIDVGGGGWNTIGASLRSPTSPRTQFSSPASPNTRLNFSSASSMSTNCRANSSEAFQKAASYYRRSKSDRLMGGAAAVYSDIGREYDAKAKEYSDIAAEEMMDANSSSHLLDLHGLTVPQAIKFARERTTIWWLNVDQKRMGNGRMGVKPFHIVTGMGRHSKDGNPLLYPAVSKMLIRENWKVQIERGRIVVYGAR